MAFPMFESMRNNISCSTCGTKNSKVKSRKTGQPVWHKNQEKGIGFWCKYCYTKFYNKRKLQNLESNK